MGISDHGTTYVQTLVHNLHRMALHESGPLRVVHLSRHKWPGIRASVVLTLQPIVK